MGYLFLNQQGTLLLTLAKSGEGGVSLIFCT